MKLIAIVALFLSACTYGYGHVEAKPLGANVYRLNCYQDVIACMGPSDLRWGTCLSCLEVARKTCPTGFLVLPGDNLTVVCR